MKRLLNIYVLLLTVLPMMAEWPATPTLLPTPRKVITLTDGWTIKNMLDVKKSAKGQSVTIPHTWNVEFQKDAQGNILRTANNTPVYERGAMCYQRNLNITANEMNGKRAYLYFEGVNSVADVFINHKPVGNHKGGYTAFCLEITKQLKDGDNLLEVFCSNAWRDDVLPISGDFNVYGGIHRPCHLIITGQENIRPNFYASPGVLIKQKDITKQKAELNVVTYVSTLDSTIHKAKKSIMKEPVKGLSLKAMVIDANGKVVAQATDDTIKVSDMRRGLVQIPLSVASPHLWQAKKAPYLYTVRVELMRNGNVVDAVEQQTGFRNIKVDPQQGTFINGIHTPVHGFCRHDDVAGRGSALLSEDYQRDMDLILESGATGMRLAHYPHGEQIYDLADKNGIILWTEIPFCGPGGMAYAGYLPTVRINAYQCVNELVYQKFNHPSICFWGIFNEVLTDCGDRFYDYGNPVQHIKSLNRRFKTLDSSRPTAFATCVDQNNYKGCADLIGWNKYFGWYSDATAGASKFFDNAHAEADSIPVGVSEYGAGASPNHHLPFGQLAQEQVAKSKENTVAGPVGGLRSDSHFHPEEAQTYCHEGNWAVFSKRPYLWCEFVWLFADIQSYQRTEGERDGFNDKGMLTYDRKTKKDAFYFYKAQWNPEPMAYITSRRSTERTDSVIDIKAYSNLKDVTLYVNGKKVSKVKPDDLHRAIWTGVPLTSGANTIRIEGKANGKLITDECIWNYKK